MLVMCLVDSNRVFCLAYCMQANSDLLLHVLLIQLRKRVEDKNRLLRQLAASAAAASGMSGSSNSGLSPVDLSGLSERWDSFVGQLQVYDSHLESQRKGLQQQLTKKIEDFCGTIAGFGAR